MKRLVYLIVAVVFVTALLVASNQLMATPDGKVLICHVPPGNPANAHVIEVSANAIPAHIEQHGDCFAKGYVGDPCDCECFDNGDRN